MCYWLRDNWWKALISIVVLTILAWITAGLIYDWKHPISNEERIRREYVRECSNLSGTVPYTVDKPWRCDRP